MWGNTRGPAVAEAEHLIEVKIGGKYTIRLTHQLLDTISIAALRRKNATYGSSNIPNTEILTDIESYDDWESMAKEKYPHWYDAVSVCGDKNPAFIASVAGAVVILHAMMCQP